MSDSETAAKLTADLATIEADLAMLESNPATDPKTIENYRQIARNLRALIISYGGDPYAQRS